MNNVKLTYNNERPGDMIRKLRESKGMTKKELGELAGVSPVTLYNWETGAKVPNMDNFERVMAALDADVCILTEEVGTNVK